MEQDHGAMMRLCDQVAALLRGVYHPSQHSSLMLPIIALRQLDDALAPTKARVICAYERYKDMNGAALAARLNQESGLPFYNRSMVDFSRCTDAERLRAYIAGFSPNVQRLLALLACDPAIVSLQSSGLLAPVIGCVTSAPMPPGRVMGAMYEALHRRAGFGAGAGEHFTLCDVARLMARLVFFPDEHRLAAPDVRITLFDPACGVGGLLATARRVLRERRLPAQLREYGQECNPTIFAIAALDALLTSAPDGAADDALRCGDSLADDRFAGETFDYFLANPPFGVDWKKQQKEIEREHEELGFAGRFGAGLPRVNDGALLFLQHMIAKFKPVQPERHRHGSRLAIVFSGSPLFTGGAGSGESNIRTWIIENDWLEAIIALPEQMFYNTGIGTYIWVVTNRKEPRRKGKIQLLDARDVWTPGGSEDSKRSLGDKRRHLSAAQIEAIVRLYGRFEHNERSKIFDNADFGSTRVAIERPLRLTYRMTVENKARFLNAFPHLLDDVQAIDQTFGREPKCDWNAVWEGVQDLLHARRSRWKAVEQKRFREVFTEKDPRAAPVLLPSLSGKGKGGLPAYEPDPDLRDFENVPLKEDIEAYFEREVRPHVPDAWMDRSKDRVGYEINFNRYFYTYTPPRPLEAIDAELKQVEEEILRLLRR